MSGLINLDVAYGCLGRSYALHLQYMPTAVARQIIDAHDMASMHVFDSEPAAEMLRAAEAGFEHARELAGWDKSRARIKALVLLRHAKHEVQLFVGDLLDGVDFAADDLNDLEDIEAGVTRALVPLERKITALARFEDGDRFTIQPPRPERGIPPRQWINRRRR